MKERSRRASESMAGALTTLLICGGAAVAQNAYKFDAATVSGFQREIRFGNDERTSRGGGRGGARWADHRMSPLGHGEVWGMNGGTTYKEVFDRHSVQSIGAVTIDPSNPKTVWVGTGSLVSAIAVGGRRSIQIDGQRRELDERRTKEQQHIAKILVDRKMEITIACAP